MWNFTFNDVLHLNYMFSLPFPHIFFFISHNVLYMTPSVPHTGSCGPCGHIRGHDVSLAADVTEIKNKNINK